MDASLPSLIRQRWADAACLPVSAFSNLGVRVTAAAHGRTTPPRWFGALSVGGQTMVTAPDEMRGQALSRVLASVSITDAEQLRQAVTTRSLPGVTEVLGPGWLSYAAPGAQLRPLDRGPEGRVRVEALGLPGGLADLAGLLQVCSPEEVAESGVEELTHLLVVRDGDAVVATAGWQVWPGAVAHVGVLAAPSVRGRGVAAAVAAAAVSAALAQGLLVQWRARPPASRRLAQRLGFVNVGWQLSWR